MPRSCAADSSPALAHPRSSPSEFAPAVRRHCFNTLPRVAHHPSTVCDVFTDRPLTGNQLAVFTEAERIPAEHFQALARELNLAETVFALPAESGGDVRIRIFTPTTELPFAGHPVLGSAFVLPENLGAPTIRLETG